MSRIILKRVEYVKEYYQVSWNEDDYQSFLQWLENKTEPHDVARYNVLKDLNYFFRFPDIPVSIF